MKVLLATGGSGGHIFPAVQTALELKSRGHEAIIAGALGEGEAKVRAQGLEASVIASAGLKGKSPAAIANFTSAMLSAVKSSLSLISAIKPQKVIGFGGYGSFPLVLAARLRGVPAMIHEQNVVPGKANKILSSLVPKVAVSFPQAMAAFKGKSVLTGCPCHAQPSRRPAAAVRAELGLRESALVVVLLGGSQGSQALNAAFFSAMNILCKDMDIAGVHMTGKSEAGEYARKYQEENIPVVVRDFYSPIEELYAVADAAVSRAGAATVSELGINSIPSILVPYPFAASHQEHNARVLVSTGSALMLLQRDLTGQKLAQELRQMLSQLKEWRQRAAAAAKDFNADAAERLANALEAL